MNEILSEVVGHAGLITLNRPRAVNALSLPMVRELTRVLRAWAHDPQVHWVALRGMGRDGAFGAFCAGGDIRFFHEAAIAGDPAIDDFFTEEYALNHLIHAYPKPTVAFMDGIIMGGGMGLAQGCTLRVATERMQMAMPETKIGLFPDVGGGWFLSRCPGSVGEYLALTGQSIRAGAAVAVGLADVCLPWAELEGLWTQLGEAPADLTWDALRDRLCKTAMVRSDGLASARASIDQVFSLPTVADMLARLTAMAQHDADWAVQTRQALLERSPLMMSVTLELIRRARHMGIADDLRQERDLVRHCFADRLGARSETVEGIRALAIDKDQQPKWNPASVAEVSPEMVARFFDSPWPAHAHPLRDLV